jgi:hypothetical protein
MRDMIAVGAAAVALTGAGAGAAAAAEPAEFRFGFETTRPATPTGLRLHVVYRDPENPEGKAPVLTAAAFALPDGTRIDNAAVPRCAATDEQFRARGRDACPPDTRIGEGKLVATTGTPGDPVTTDVTVFNGDGQLIELVTFEGTNTMAGLDRLTVEGSTLRAHPPATPGGPPDGRTSIREVRIAIPARGGLVTTPPSCPADRTWRGLGTFSFEGHPEAKVPATAPCGAPSNGSSVAPPPAGGDGAGPSVAPRRTVVRVLPRRVRSGRSTRVRVVVTGSCAAGATVRIGLRRARTDAAGRVTMRVRIRRSAAVRVTKRGCAPARGRLAARRGT